ncbi:MAG: metallophosphoesterase [Candidatus Methanoperedens sp.]|nr:metallophosphoesterase [Candidatus Methanoperedens sp.]
MMIGVIGDVHGEFLTIESIMKDNSEIKCWICTGDLADKTMEYLSPPAPLYWISGNHENWDEIEKMENGILKIPNFIHMINAETVQLGKTRILGMGGNYSPTYYGFKKAELPKSRKRHYVKDEIEKCLNTRSIDILITHEAPSPYYRNGEDIGRQEITDILRATKPGIHFFGHHHKFGVFEIEKGIKSVCLDKPKNSWIKLDTESFRFEQIITEFHFSGGF